MCSIASGAPLLCPVLCQLICFMPSHRSAVGPKCVECACCVWGCITEWACGSGVPPRTTACVEGGATGIVALTLSGAMVQLASRRAGRGPPGWGAFSSRDALHLLGGLLYPLLHQRPAQQARDPHTGVDAGGSDAGGRRQSRNWLHAGGRAGTCCNCMQRRARPPLSLQPGSSGSHQLRPHPALPHPAPPPHLKWRMRPCTGQAAASPRAQMVCPSSCLVTSHSMSISSSLRAAERKKRGGG